MVVASLLYAVCLYRAYGALDTLSLYIYYELLIIYKKFFCIYRPNSFYTMAVYTEAYIESQFSGIFGLKGLTT